MDISSALNDVLRIVIIISFVSLIKILLHFLSIKLEDSKYQSIIRIISSVVDEVSQTYVKVLKENKSFDENSQKEALKLSVDKINEQLTSEMKDYIDKSYGDKDKWIKSQIESHIWNNNQKSVTENNDSKDKGPKIKQMNLFE